jgi:hypothetical protein
MHIALITKRIGDLIVGEVVRGGNIAGWSEVSEINAVEGIPAMQVTWYRPATNGGIVDPNQRGRSTKRTQILPSFDLVEVQVRITG